MSSTRQRIKLAVISSAHGIRGQVKLRLLSDAIPLPDQLYDDSGLKKFRLTVNAKQADVLIVSIDGVVDRTQAEKLKGTTLFAYVEEAIAKYSPPDAHTNIWRYEELIGLNAVTADGKPYGQVRDVMNFGAGDILELTLISGRSEMLPFNAVFFGEVDTSAGEIVVIPPHYLESEAEE